MRGLKQKQMAFLLLLLFSLPTKASTPLDAEHYSFERIGPALLTSATAHVVIDIEFETLINNAQHAHDLYFLHTKHQPTGTLANSFNTKYENFLYKQELVLTFLTHLDPNLILRLGPSATVAEAVSRSKVTVAKQRLTKSNESNPLDDQNSEKNASNSRGALDIINAWNKTAKPRRSTHYSQTRTTPAVPKTRKQVIAAVEEHLGGKYLVFVSSRSVKMRGFSFLSFYTFLGMCVYFSIF
jgi:hypothetical protein